MGKRSTCVFLCCLFLSTSGVVGYTEVHAQQNVPFSQREKNTQLQQDNDTILEESGDWVTDASLDANGIQNAQRTISPIAKIGNRVISIGALVITMGAIIMSLLDLIFIQTPVVRSVMLQYNIPSKVAQSLVNASGNGSKGLSGGKAEGQFGSQSTQPNQHQHQGNQQNGQNQNKIIQYFKQRTVELIVIGFLLALFLTSSFTNWITSIIDILF